MHYVYRSYNSKNHTFLYSSVAVLALVFVAARADAGTFLVSNQTELDQAILDAQASLDSSSTITLLADVQFDTVAPGLVGKSVLIETGPYTLTLASGQPLVLSR